MTRADSSVQELLDRMTRPPSVLPKLSAADVLFDQGTSVWQSDELVGPMPWFYPLYRQGNHYSYSVLPLILQKGQLDVNEREFDNAAKSDYRSHHSNATIDTEIVRIGRPLSLSRRTIREPGTFARELADAIKRDALAIESRYPGFTNVIFCGGKDSQNLTLLPWRNNVIVASGPPNDELNRSFLDRNDLDHDLIRLGDDDLAYREVEILSNASASSLEHKRWVSHIMTLAAELDFRIIFWAGQLADGFLTRLWTSYDTALTGPHHQTYRVIRRLERSPLGPLVERLDLPRRRLSNSLYYRGAMGEGHHMGLLRTMTGCPAFSAYQGPLASDVLARTSLEHAVDPTLRNQVGNFIAGRSVWYPSTNPGPSLMQGKSGWHHPDNFIRQLDAAGVRIRRS